MMAHFSYTATRNDGEVYKGAAEAADRFELYQIIRREGGHILSLEERSSANYFSWSYWNAKMSTAKEYDKILFARNLGAMLAAGLSLARALSVLERQTKNSHFASIISEISSEVRRGDPLHAALEKHPRDFPKLMVAMVKAGEEGGDLSGTLTVTAEQMERIHDLKKKVRGAAIYPSIVLCAIVGIAILMMIKVVPTLAQTFREMDAQLPAATTFVIGVSDLLVHNTLVAIGGVLSFFVALVAGLKTETGRRVRDYVFVHMPLIGPMVREINAARTSRTLASLTASGVNVIESLEITSEVVQNSYFKDVLKEAQSAVAEGQPLSATFAKHENLYPPFVGEMMAVGEETGQTSDMLKKLALYYESEVDRKTKDMSTVIEPFLMLLIGGAVGFFAIAMISPIYQLSEHI